MVYFLGGLLLFIHVRASRPRVPSQQYHLGHNLPFVHCQIMQKNASMERKRTGIFVHKPTFCC